jgi:cytochrome c2
MPPKKKAAAGGGDAAKGEKVFKNLCSACHSLSVSLLILLFQQKLNKSN